MRHLKIAVVLSGLIAAPLSARAADVWELTFGGPQGGEFVISDLNGTPYVSSYYLPAVAGYGSIPTAVSPSWRQTLPNIPENIMANQLLSTVNLTSTGGSITIGPSFEYVGYYDGELNITLNYILSTQENVGSTFFNTPIYGSYSSSYYVNATGYGSDHDFSGGGGGTFTSLSAQIPEPATWMMLLAGFSTIGALLRSRSGRQRARSASA